MKFKIGDKVVEKKSINATYDFHSGTVIAFSPDNKPLVKWYIDIKEHHPNELVTVASAEIEKKRLDEEQSKLEAEYNEVRSKIIEKLNQATVLVKQAYALAQSADKDLYDVYHECRDLATTLVDAGWTPSTMRC